MVYPKGLPYNEGVRKRRTLYIKNPAAHRLAQQSSKQMGLTLTDTVIKALEDQSRKISKTGRPLDRKRIDAISAKVTTLPVLDARTPDEILGYDKYGVPR
jgi:antitoxin VapB